jgi:hypothetical protein
MHSCVLARQERRKGPLTDGTLLRGGTRRDRHLAHALGPLGPLSQEVRVPDNGGFHAVRLPSGGPSSLLGARLGCTAAGSGHGGVGHAGLALVLGFGFHDRPSNGKSVDGGACNPLYSLPHGEPSCWAAVHQEGGPDWSVLGRETVIYHGLWAGFCGGVAALEHVRPRQPLRPSSRLWRRAWRRGLVFLTILAIHRNIGQDLKAQKINTEFECELRVDEQG